MPRKKATKQYNQEDLNKIVSVDPVESVVKDTALLELPQIEIKEEPEYTHEELHEALMTAQDLLERSMIPFLLLGETAYAIRAADVPVLEGQVIHLGVLKRHANPESLSTLKSLLPKDSYMDHKIITFLVGEVPVQIDIIYGDYDFFGYPDSKGYYTTNLKLPNPFDEYWKWKGEVQ